MRNIYIVLILFFLIIMEGVSQELLPETIAFSNFLIISHWIFVFLILIGTFFDENNGFYTIVYAVIFGLLVDIVYTDILGVYMVAYSLTIFIYLQFTKLFQPNFIMTFIFTVISLLLVDHVIYLLYITIGKITLSWNDYFIFRLLPTVLGNIVFFVIIYPISKNRLIVWRRKDKQSKLY